MNKTEDNNQNAVDGALDEFVLVPNTEGWKTVEVNGKDVQIPKEWTSPTLHEVAVRETKGGTTYSKNVPNVPGGIPVITPSELSDSIEGVKPIKTRIEAGGRGLVKAGAVAIANIASVGKTRFLTEDCFCNPQVLAYRAKNEDPLFFSYTMREIGKVAASRCAGSAVAFINSTDVAQIQGVFPPLPEQTRIAAVLSAQERQIEDLRAAAKTERERLAWLSDELLSGRVRVVEREGGQPFIMNDGAEVEMTEILNAFDLVANTEGWKTVEVNGKDVQIPGRWSASPLSKKSLCLDSKRKPITEKDRKAGTTPYWGANGIVDYVDGFILNGNYVFLGEDAAPFFDKNKKVAFVVDGKSWPNNHIHILKAKENSKYLEAALNWFDYSVVLHTENRPKLTKRAMMDMELLFPPIPEQARIAAVLAALELYTEDIEALIEIETKRLSWLSDELLSGRVRVESRATP